LWRNDGNGEDREGTGDGACFFDTFYIEFEGDRNNLSEMLLLG